MKNSKVTVITDVLLLILSFIMLVSAIIADKYAVNLKQMYNVMFANRELWPISNLIEAKTKCPTGFSKLYNFTYPGNEAGCYNNLTGSYSHSACPMSKTSDQIDIPSIKPTPTELWRNVLICAERMDLNQIPHIYMPYNYTCPSGFQNCGMFNINKDILCLHRNYLCPVNYLTVTKNLNETKNLYDWLELDDSIYLAYGNDNTTDRFIPVDFQVSQGYPCFRAERISNTTPVYPYQTKGIAYGCNPHDPLSLDQDYLDRRYVKMDEMSITTFYEYNDLESVLYFPDMKNWKFNKYQNISLFSRTRIMPKLSCDYNDTKRSKFTEHLEEVKEMHFYLIVTQLGNMIILCTFMSLLSLMKIGSKVQNILISLLKLIFCVAFICANIYITQYNIRKSVKIEQYVFSLLQEKCLDDISTYAYGAVFQVGKFIELWEQVLAWIFWLNIPYGVMVVIQALKFIHKTYHRIRNRRRNDEAKALLLENLKGHKNPLSKE